MREMANTTDDCQSIKDTKQKSIKSKQNWVAKSENEDEFATHMKIEREKSVDSKRNRTFRHCSLLVSVQVQPSRTKRGGGRE